MAWLLQIAAVGAETLVWHACWSGVCEDFFCAFSSLLGSRFADVDDRMLIADVDRLHVKRNHVVGSSYLDIVDLYFLM